MAPFGTYLWNDPRKISYHQHYYYKRILVICAKHKKSLLDKFNSDNNVHKKTEIK